MLELAHHVVVKPRFGAIDAHNHLGAAFGEQWERKTPSELLEVMNDAGIEAVVNLDGAFGEALEQEIEKWSPLANRVLTFAGVSWKRLAGSNVLGERAALDLERAARQGAKGLKIWKDFGLNVRDQAGRLIPVDTPRLNPLWQAAGELGLPVTIHVGDPLAFFCPPDTYNERYDELQRNPEWSFYGSDYPRFETLIEALEHVVAAHPKTIFIGAHVGCYAENLRHVGGMLDRLPNFFVDIGARVAELGRQPYSAREFFIRYADRILFGTDAPPDPRTYRVYYRFLETRDECFPYWRDGDRPWQGRWYIYGLGLPESILQKVYFGNAQRIFRLPTSSFQSTDLLGDSEKLAKR
jgi:predicted TIM-barrel fold metal-dependent hydrolase